MIAPDPVHYGWWLAARASGIVALALVTLSVGVGLAIAGRVARGPGCRAPSWGSTSRRRSRAWWPSRSTGSHCCSIPGCVPGRRRRGALRHGLPPAVHRPGHRRRLFGGAARPVVLRAPAHRCAPVAQRAPRDGARLPARRGPRPGAGTDASTPWLRVFLIVTGIPIAGLFVHRLRRRPTRAPRPGPRRERRDERGDRDRGRRPRRSALLRGAAGPGVRRSPSGSSATSSTAPTLDRPPLSKGLLAGTTGARELALRAPGPARRARRRARPGGPRPRAWTPAAGTRCSPAAVPCATTGWSSPPAERPACSRSCAGARTSTSCARSTTRSRCVPCWGRASASPSWGPASSASRWRRPRGRSAPPSPWWRPPPRRSRPCWASASDAGWPSCRGRPASRSSRAPRSTRRTASAPRVGALRLGDGRRVACDAVLMAVGMVPGHRLAGRRPAPPGRDRRRPRGSHPPAPRLRGRRRARSRPLGARPPASGATVAAAILGVPRPGAAAGGLLERPARRAPAVRRHRRRPRPRGGRGRPPRRRRVRPLPPRRPARRGAARRAPPRTCLPCAGACRRPPPNTERSAA